MTCEELMKRDVVVVAPDDTVEEAARRMRDFEVGFLPVVDNERRVVGTLTDRDIAIRLVADNMPAATHVEDVMTDDLVACRPYDDVRTAENLMAIHKKARILCLADDGVLAGVISLSDVVGAEASPERVATTFARVAARETHGDVVTHH